MMGCIRAAGAPYWNVCARNRDLFDVFAYIRFATSPMTRPDRAEAASSDGSATADANMSQFLMGVLQAYEALREAESATRKLSDFLTARYGSLTDAKAALGEVATIRQAFVNVQHELYRQ